MPDRHSAISPLRRKLFPQPPEGANYCFRKTGFFVLNHVDDEIQAQFPRNDVQLTAEIVVDRPYQTNDGKVGILRSGISADTVACEQFVQSVLISSLHLFAFLRPY